MSKEKQITREINNVLAALRTFNNVLAAKGQKFDIKKIEPLYKALEKEVSKQGHALIELAKVPKPARNAKDILADLAESERLTPELLDEIKKAHAKKEKSRAI